MAGKGSSADPRGPKNGTRPDTAGSAASGRTRVLARRRPGGRRGSFIDSIHHGVGGLDRLDHLPDGERLPQDAVEAGLHQLRGLAVGDPTAHRDDAGDLEFLVAADHRAELPKTLRQRLVTCLAIPARLDRQHQ